MPVHEAAPTLVVVDVQPIFGECVDWRLVLAVEGLVLKCLEAKSPIVVLEYGPNPDGDPDLRTHPYIMRHLTDSAAGGLFALMTKFKTDGSDEVLQACHRNGFGTHHFRICGVKTHACVKQTASGLAQKLPSSKIDIIKNACNCHCAFDADWGNMPVAPNIALV